MLSLISSEDDGTIQGEFGYATADGFYLTTVYATDINGKFVILERRKEAISNGELESFYGLFIILHSLQAIF